MPSHHKYLMILTCLMVFLLIGNISSYAESGGTQPPPTTAPILLPDLKPTSLYFNADCDLMAEITNEGPGDFNGEVGYLLQTNEVPPGSAYGTFDMELAPGEKKTLLLLYEAQISFHFPEQNHQMTLWINPPAANFSLVFGFPHVLEASEANNRLTVETNCEGADFHTLETVGGVPDLVPEIIAREIPRDPSVNDSPYTRQWTAILLVTNKGTATAGEFRVTVEKFMYSDWEQAPLPKFYPFDVAFDRLRPGHHASYWLNVLYWGPGGSRVGYQVTVDPDNAVSESNENNNSAEKWFPALIMPKPELLRQVTMIGKIDPKIFVFCPDIVISIYRTRCDCERTPIYERRCVKWDPPGPPGPGSVCMEWETTVSYETECEVKVSYVVKNIGTQDAGVFHVKLESSTGHTGTDYFSGLLVDEEKYHHWLFTTDAPGSVTATVTADINDAITECDEDNNTDSTSLRCQ